LIAEIVALFITAMDKIKLDIRSMDEIHGELKVSFCLVFQMNFNQCFGNGSALDWLPDTGGVKSAKTVKKTEPKDRKFTIKS
jgi:VPS28 protein